jgi:hypothetical protein
LFQILNPREGEHLTRGSYFSGDDARQQRELLLKFIDAPDALA